MLQVIFIDRDKYQFSQAYRADASAILRQSNHDVLKHLPALEKHLTFTIYPTTNVIPETGDTATTPNPNLIQWSVNPWDDRGLEAITRAELRNTFFHEAHHAVRLQTINWFGTILADGIFEGLATVFERDIAGANPAWGVYDTKTVKPWVKELINLDERTAHRPDWFFEHPDGRRWIAYKVGTFIVDQAIKHHPNQSAITLVNETADSIIKLASLSV